MIEWQWQGIRLQQNRYRVLVGEQELALHRCYRDAGGPVLFLLGGFNRDLSLFWPDSSAAGLVPYLAAQGYDVFVADWRGKGGAQPPAGRASQWGIHQLVTEDMPALLRRLAELRPGAACIWLGQGLACSVLLASYVRHAGVGLPVRGLIHLDGARRRLARGPLEQLRRRWWLLNMKLSGLLLGRAGWRRGAGESRRLLADWVVWKNSADWLDPVDAFNYRAALRYCALPPSLYLASSRASGADLRHWLAELGRHDARILTFDRGAGDTGHKPNTSVSGDTVAGDERFAEIGAWIAKLVEKPAF